MELTEIQLTAAKDFWLKWHKEHGTIINGQFVKDFNINEVLAAYIAPLEEKILELETLVDTINLVTPEEINLSEYDGKYCEANILGTRLKCKIKVLNGCVGLFQSKHGLYLMNEIPPYHYVYNAGNGSLSELVNHKITDFKLLD